MGEKRTLQQDRIAKGLCPKCGEEAVPYFLCGECRFAGKVDRILSKGHRLGALTKIGRGKHALYSMKDMKAWDNGNWRPDPKDGDRRMLPRLRGIPVDVEGQLIAILQHFDRPVSLEEIREAWAKLREHRGGAITTNVVAIIRAKDERSAKLARRAARRPAPAQEGAHA